MTEKASTAQSEREAIVVVYNEPKGVSRHEVKKAKGLQDLRSTLSCGVEPDAGEDPVKWSG